MNNEENSSKKNVNPTEIGDNTIAYGNFPNGLKAGNNSIIIGPTHGTNVIIGGGTAIGHGAVAGENGVAIGNGAGAGNNFVILMNQMRQIANDSGNSEIIEAFNNFATEVNKPQTNTGALQKTWNGLKNLATIDGLIGLSQRINDIWPHLGIG